MMPCRRAQPSSTARGTTPPAGYAPISLCPNRGKSADFVLISGRYTSRGRPDHLTTSEHSDGAAAKPTAPADTGHRTKGPHLHRVAGMGLLEETQLPRAWGAAAFARALGARVQLRALLDGSVRRNARPKALSAAPGPAGRLTRDDALRFASRIADLDDHLIAAFLSPRSSRSPRSREQPGPTRCSTRSSQ